MKHIKTYGAEIEKPVADKNTSLPHKTSQEFFEKLKKEAEKRNTFVKVHKSDLKPEVSLGVISSDLGEQGLDNGFNLLESSLAYKTSLSDLQKSINTDLAMTQKLLAKENASLFNLSIHPLGERDLATYEQFVAPKGVYPFIWYRGWDHTAGIDARAQNSPSTGVSVSDAADAVSVIIGAGASFIGLFGNGPYENGQRSAYKEARCTMWERMMKYSSIEGDRKVSRFPEKRFKTLAQYFTWLFGGNTAIWFTITSGDGKDYKGIGDRIILIESNPSVLQFLSKPSWQGMFLKDILNNFPAKTQEVTPHISHMTTLQFAQFIGARIRFGLKDQDNFPIKEFVQACKKETEKKVEDIFSKFAEFMYIEGRDAGANFPDKEINNVGTDIAESVVIAPSALQAGLLQNLPKAVSYIDSFEWNQLTILREKAIRDGLMDNKVYEFTKKIVELAAEGLASDEQKMLAYPEWVLKTRKNGADRAIEFVENHKGNLKQALKDLIQYRTIVV